MVVEGLLRLLLREFDAGAGCWMPDAGCWMLDSGCQMLDVARRIKNLESRIQNQESFFHDQIMKLFLLHLLLILSLTVSAQKIVRTYHDPEKQKLQEEYVVANDDPTLIIGSYKRYYENGNVMMDGNFNNGKKEGPFTEYHENGNLARKFIYVNGLRHGTVEVFN